MTSAAVPTLCFRIALHSHGQALRGLTLGIRVLIHAERRRHVAAELPRLGELFGPPELWSRSLTPIHWTQMTVPVAPFQEDTTVDARVACTYDFEVAAAKYLAGLDGGEVALELQFEGMMFWSTADGRLQSAPVPSDSEAQVVMPLSVWRDALRAAYGDCAWVRLRRDVFGALQAERSRRGLTSWEHTISALLEEARA